MPEKPTFHPIWPLPGAGPGWGAGADSSREEVCVQGQPVQERLHAAALAIPGGLLSLGHARGMHVQAHHGACMDPSLRLSATPQSLRGECGMFSSDMWLPGGQTASI